MSESGQYDSLLGGNQELPPAIRLINFTAARCKEIAALKRNLKPSKGGGKLIFQKLPAHMRRRVMSHNAKRLPRRLREAHMNQLKKSGLGVKQKRPSRKYRRRPRNLLAEYTRRQRKLKWLETHIWHAKRFHMIQRWGYKLPQAPCDKSFRCCYRATAKHCLLQDVSYIGCIEINGKEDHILEKFSKIYDNNVTLSIGAKAHISGNREGELTLFDNDSVVGTVSFHWMPKGDGEMTRKLWIWVHASIFERILNLIVRVFDLHLKTEESENCYTSDDNGVTLYDLRLNLNRFRLTGPLSDTIVRKSLVSVDLNNEPKDWLKTHLNDVNKELYLKQNDYWENIKEILSTRELSPHMIIGLIATDPRYSMPKKRTKAVCKTTTFVDFLVRIRVPEYAGVSPIWNRDVRKIVVENKMSNSDLNKARQELLVPGSDLETPGISVPYLLIQSPGSRINNIGYGSGWDVIIPSGWARPTWLTFIMWGARPGGLRESESTQFEMGRLSIFEPDTDGGRDEDNRITELSKRRYFSLPPNKRVNYNKYSIVTPFECKWNVLLKDWNEVSEGSVDFKIMRDREALRMIDENLTSKRYIATMHIDFSTSYIVPVKLKLNQRGTPKRYSIICLPTEDDLKLGEKFALMEPPMNDLNQEKRRQFRKDHKQLLQKLKRYRKLSKSSGKKCTARKNYVEEYKEEMSKLWLPDVETGIRHSCSREIIGWVSKGDFSFTIGKGVAVGYVVLRAFLDLFLAQKRNRVLVRNTSSRQYRIATIEIVT